MATGRDNYYVKVGMSGLLFVEPQREASSTPLIDDATKRMAAALRSAQTPGYGYLGTHTCRCGAESDNVDYFIDQRFVTNSLAVHYLAYHRDEVPLDELADVLTLSAVHAEPTVQELTGR